MAIFFKIQAKNHKLFSIRIKNNNFKKQIRKIKGETNEKYLYLLQRKID